MPEDGSSRGKVDPNLVTEIVCGYVAKNGIAADQIGKLIATVHQTLSALGKIMKEPAVPAAQKLKPAVPVRRSVQADHVLCLECGFRGKSLRRHLRTAHGLEASAYRTRWNLPSAYRLVAPAYSEHRSAMAKQIGLGRKPAESETPAPRRRGRPRQAPAR
jgi:predicted transcriptional regulator